MDTHPIQNGKETFVQMCNNKNAYSIIQSKYSKLNSLNILLHFSTCYIVDTSFWCFCHLLPCSTLRRPGREQSAAKVQRLRPLPEPPEPEAPVWPQQPAQSTQIWTNLRNSVHKVWNHAQMAQMAFFVDRIFAFSSHWQGQMAEMTMEVTGILSRTEVAKVNRLRTEFPWVPNSFEIVWKVLEGSGRRIQLGLQLFHCLPAPKLIKKHT